MTSRRRIVTAHAVSNLDQAIRYLRNLYSQLPWTLRTEHDVRLFLDCLGRGPMAWERWSSLRRLVSPAHADGFILRDVVLPTVTQLRNVRESLKQPLFNQPRQIVDRSVMLGGAAHAVMARLTLLAGVRSFDTDMHLLDVILNQARIHRNRPLFEWCLGQRRASFARHDPDIDVEPWNRLERADFEITLDGNEAANWPTELVFLMTLWGGDDAMGAQESLRALGFGEHAPNWTERKVLREYADRDAVRQALESALYSSREDALRAAQQGLSRVGATVRGAQRLEALSELREREAQRVRRVVSPIEIESLDDREVQSLGPRSDPLASVIDSEDASALASAINQLSPSQRRAVLALQRALADDRPLRHYYSTRREYKTAHDHIRAARPKLARLLKLS